VVAAVVMAAVAADATAHRAGRKLVVVNSEW
jgi:hypothetical protein